MIQDRLPSNVDPTGYQWEHNGQVMMLTEMSRADLLQALCQTMDTLEVLEVRASQVTQALQNWRKGRPQPHDLQAQAV